jgi:serine/threonine protein phosphatase PrpC
MAPMQRTVTQSAGWHIETWEQPSGAAASQDAQLVWPDPGAPRLRVAVLDGVTPTRRCRTVAGVAGPMYAAAVTRLTLQHSGSGLTDSLRAANRHLHDRSVARSRDQAQTCVTAADIYDDGRIEVVRAGDCEAWARTPTGWTQLGTGTALVPSVEAAWQEWQERNRHCGHDERNDAEERFLGRPTAWTSTALGRFPQPVIRTFTLRGAHELVLASDGARLSEDVLDDLPAWLAGLRRWERRRAAFCRAAEKVHDDVTVIRLTSGRSEAMLALAA